MAQVSRAAYAAAIAAKAADNSTGDITAQDLRELLTDLADSGLWAGEAVRTVNGRTGTDVTLAADDVSDGTGKVMMTPAERTKLAGVEAGAQVNPSGAAIVSAINAQLGSTVWQGGSTTVADGDYGAISVASGVWSIDDGVVTLPKIAASAREGGGARLQTTDGGLPAGAILAAGSDGRTVAAGSATAGTISAKAAPVAADRFLMFDTEASNELKTATGTAIQALVAPAATTSVAGRVELATTAETTTGTDATRAVTPAGLAGQNFVRSNTTGGADLVTAVVSLTQAEYDALGGSLSASTLYAIVG